MSASALSRDNSFDASFYLALEEAGASSPLGNSNDMTPGCSNESIEGPSSPTTSQGWSEFDCCSAGNHTPSAYHTRSLSISKFKSDGTIATAAALKTELDKLLANSNQDPVFKREMEGFYQLFLRYLKNRNAPALNWNSIRSPSKELITSYEDLNQESFANPAMYSKLAVLKLNGGLGTTMGCVGPKSAIDVRDGMTFLDLTVRQIEFLNESQNTNVPLILMNSFNTDMETKKTIQHYSQHKVKIYTFNQSRYPRISKETLLPIPTSQDSPNCSWYPPGHGDVFQALNNSGLLDKLISEGREYLFVSNIDNLGATIDPAILEYFSNSDIEYLMEVTNKTKADIKGGTLIDYDGQVRLLEVAQVPKEHMNDFTSIKKFKIFNTNNIWIKLSAIRRILDSGKMSLDVIVNQKTIEDNLKIIQLETAIGSAIKHFNNAKGISVPRSRFLPVKGTSDLFLIQSDLYSIKHGQLTMNPKRLYPGVPIVKLGDHFTKVPQYLKRFASPPQILELDHLTVSGDVTFGANVILKGTVIIVASQGSKIFIPTGSILDDKVVSGNLSIVDH